MYAVIQVDLDYYEPFVEGIECVATCNTEQEASDFVFQRIKENDDARNAREKYIGDFVDSIQVPENTAEFSDFLLKYDFVFGYIAMTPKNFKPELTRYLTSNYSDVKELDFYNPPKINVQNRSELHVVEING